jgi:hypothetical protein
VTFEKADNSQYQITLYGELYAHSEQNNLERIPTLPLLARAVSSQIGDFAPPLISHADQIVLSCIKQQESRFQNDLTPSLDIAMMAHHAGKDVWQAVLEEVNRMGFMREASRALNQSISLFHQFDQHDLPQQLRSRNPTGEEGNGTELAKIFPWMQFSSDFFS